MGDAVLSPLLQVVLEKLSTPLVKEIANICGLKREVKKLRQTLRVIHAVLEDAEERQITDKTVRAWLAELSYVAYDADDLLDELSMKAALSAAQTSGFTEQVCTFIPRIVAPLVANFLEILPRLKQIKETLEGLAEEKSNFMLGERVVHASKRKSRQTGSFIIESEIFGRDGDREKMVEILLSQTSTSHGCLTVIPIVGLGGVGKTTLAQLVYRDERVDGHFDMKMWVSVNEDFDVERILRSIIASATRTKCDLFGLEVLQSNIYHLLLGKRYLLVLDDVWNDDDDDSWELLRVSLCNRIQGSRVIVTTRSQKVASVIGTACCLHLKDVQKSENGDVTECKMHGLIHDLAQSIAGDEFAIIEHDRIPRHLSRTRHSTVVCDMGLYSVPEALYEAKKLRTLILLFPKGDLGEVPPNVFPNFRYLRALDLSGSGIKRLNDSISNFILLRYLDLSNSNIETLPESLCSLYNLQVINLSNCCNLIKLPGQTNKLFRLRHLIINGCERLTELPAWLGELKYLQTLPLFIVGRESGKSLDQLQTLNLGGELKIQSLENVRHTREAMEADLIGKRNLQSLGLHWGNNQTDSNGDGLDHEISAEQVFENLQPHRYLKKLSVEGYQGRCFPRWMDALKLPNITQIVFRNCTRCEKLPTLGQLPFLKVLHIEGMSCVEYIGHEFYGDGAGRPFLSLKELTIIDFPHLEFWWSANGMEEFPSLANLAIKNCPRLRNIPCFPQLQHLKLHNCNEMILQSVSKLTSLNSLAIDVFKGQLVLLESLLHNNSLLMSLSISSCPNLRSICPALKNLFNLKSLAFRWCDELQFSPPGLQNLTTLESLEIIECHSLISLPENLQGLSSLQSLSIENCNNLVSLPLTLQFLRTLEHLTIMYCPKLTCFPDGLQRLSSLRSISIINCPELMSLPEGLQYVTSLEILEIHSCPRLEVLPEWFASLNCLRSLVITDCQNLTSLPRGLQHLVSLQLLRIYECPNLEERCKMDMGEDWPKIRHVAHLYIGSRGFKQQDAASSSAQLFNFRIRQVKKATSVISAAKSFGLPNFATFLKSWQRQSFLPSSGTGNVLILASSKMTFLYHLG
ncbi:Rx, N-terminal [Dillenia turbinata]|uniref:Rx, N-terminal n=1 Tax=Dillenia turbinata TaxID=194707 RepID=A0AAN8ZN25_9MAGN